MPFMDGLHFSGPARKFLDNMRPSRASRAGVARTLSRAEIEDELVRLAARARNRGTQRAPRHGPGGRRATSRCRRGDGSPRRHDRRDPGHPHGPARDRRGARPPDSGSASTPDRLELFDSLQVQSHAGPTASEPRPNGPARSPRSPSSRPTSRTGSRAPSSSWTRRKRSSSRVQFPQGRFEDAHDVLGTFELVDDTDLRDSVPSRPEDLLDLLRSHHCANARVGVRQSTPGHSSSSRTARAAPPSSTPTWSSGP